MKKLVLPELTSEEMDELCLEAEEAARNCINSEVPSKKIENLIIGVEAEGSKPMKLTVDVSLEMVRPMEGFDAKKLANRAVKAAFVRAEEYLGRLACRSEKL